MSFRVSPRSWLVLALPVVGVLVLTYSATTPEPRAAVNRQAEPLRDGPLPSGGTAQLSKCGVNEWPRPEPRGRPSRASTPN